MSGGSTSTAATWLAKQRLYRRIARRLGVGPKTELRLDELPLGTVGRGTYGGLITHYFRVNGGLSIGRYCSFAADTHVLLGGNHRHDWVTTYPFPAQYPNDVAWRIDFAATRGDVVIGNDVWLGRGATIMSGVTVGDGAVIGAGAIVSRDVPPYALVVGNPGTVARLRFSDAQVARLVDIAWWNWDEPRIFKAMPSLLSGDIDAFIAGVDEGRL